MLQNAQPFRFECLVECANETNRSLEDVENYYDDRKKERLRNLAVLQQQRAISPENVLNGILVGLVMFTVTMVLYVGEDTESNNKGEAEILSIYRSLLLFTMLIASIFGCIATMTEPMKLTGENYYS